MRSLCPYVPISPPSATRRGTHLVMHRNLSLKCAYTLSRIRQTDSRTIILTLCSRSLRYTRCGPNADPPLSNLGSAGSAESRGLNPHLYLCETVVFDGKVAACTRAGLTIDHIILHCKLSLRPCRCVNRSRLAYVVNSMVRRTASYVASCGSEETSASGPMQETNLTRLQLSYTF